MNGSKLSLFLFLALLLTMLPAGAAARSFYNNPYGTYNAGWVMDYQVNCNSSPCEQLLYSQGDQYGSGPLSPFVNFSATVPGAYSHSLVDVPGNQLWLTANSDVSNPFDGNLTTALAYATGTMWDTVSFPGAAPGAVGTFVFTSHGSSNSTAGLGTIMIEAASTNPNDWHLYQEMYSIIGGMSGPITLSLTVPLDAGTIQFLATANISSSASVGSGIYSADISLDPDWSFLLPSGVTVTSASGAVYPVNAPVPEPGVLSSLTFGLLALGALKRKLLK